MNLDDCDHKLDGYYSENESKVEGLDVKELCSSNNPHSKLDSVETGPIYEPRPNLKLVEDMTFPYVEEFRDVLRDYMGRKGFLIN